MNKIKYCMTPKNCYNCPAYWDDGEFEDGCHFGLTKGAKCPTCGEIDQEYVSGFCCNKELKTIKYKRRNENESL